MLGAYFAVREGFEPSVQFPVRQFSKLILSASQAPHLLFLIQLLLFLRSANIANSISQQKKLSIINTHMVNAHQHLFKNAFYSFDFF